MLIIGEKINATRKSIDAAIKDRDIAHIQEIARAQEQAGAHVLDVNCGTVPAPEEPETMTWLVKTVQDVSSLPVMHRQRQLRSASCWTCSPQGQAFDQFHQW